MINPNIRILEGRESLVESFSKDNIISQKVSPLITNRQTPNSTTIKVRQIEEDLIEKPTTDRLNYSHTVNITPEDIETEKGRIHNVVKRALEEVEEATNNDFILMLESLRRDYPPIKINIGERNCTIKIPTELLLSIRNPESYTRARRKLNEQGIGLPTNPRIVDYRMKKEKAIRNYFGKKKGEEVSQ